MQLTRAGIARDAQGFQNAGYALPQFDEKKVIQKTMQEPVWLHFGTGNIFRAFQANVVQKLLNAGEMEQGIIAAGGSNPEIIEKVYRPHDNLSVLVTLKADGGIEKTVIGSIVESLVTSSSYGRDYARMKEIFRAPTLQMVSFTITEKGYSLRAADGSLQASVKKDMEQGPEKPVSYMGIITALLYERYQNNALPLACVSMDNCSHNGEVLYQAVAAIAQAWKERGLVEEGFVSYLQDRDRVSFPCSMIDKITPRPDARIEALLMKDGIDGLEQIVTSRGTYASVFVNAEECEYLVIEDAFPNGRPPLEKGGVIFTDRATVDKAEKMKVCTCLNPLHTALAVYGCLLGYDLISKEMENPVLKRMVEIIGYQEGLPVVVNPGILSPEKFLDEVINIRIPNPFMPDTPQRIATDTSQKLPVRYGQTVKSYLASEDLSVDTLNIIPLVFAGWIRYLMGVDDQGKPFKLSPDPLLESVCPCVAGLGLKEDQDVEKAISPILENAEIFGVNLYEAGLADKVTGYFRELTAGPGAVEATLRKYVMLSE
ncbi:MAG: mannitol dehydrogenase family protein [Eubacteriales bacterium]|nr:mannitol dehydrogenase family protein [Eubacteriales bacterium]